MKAGSSLTEAGFASIDAAFPGGVATSEDSIVEDLELLKSGFNNFHRHLEMTNVGFTQMPHPFAPSPFHHLGAIKPIPSTIPSHDRFLMVSGSQGFMMTMASPCHPLKHVEASKAGPKFPGKEQLLTFIEVPRSEMTG